MKRPEMFIENKRLKIVSSRTEDVFFSFHLRESTLKTQALILSFKLSDLISGFIFHRFLDITNKWIWRILEFRKKSLSLGKKFLEFSREILKFIWEKLQFLL